ncbi:S8 family peptidase [uncultured Robinsoniella sp.]|uniref:S8 family peptidase n=1 Tax=uncultured Robinsoniella sp. TaxID=904190 RepID=UPI00374F0D25
MATDQKIENLLNLALDATPEEREKSLTLDVGYDPIDQKWEIIVKYSGDISRLESEDIQVVELINEYAIITLPESKIDFLAAQPEVEFIEKPKRLFFSVNQGRAASCMNVLQTPAFNLNGEGIIVAVIDSGVDYTHPDFRNPNGSTRILNIWDQTLPGNPPEGFRIGTEFNQAQINAALNPETEGEVQSTQAVPSRDLSGHGTQVLGIAAGNGRASNGRYRGVAYESDIIVVKLGLARPNSFPRTTELMQALDYVIRKAIEYQKPVAINLSFGTVYGSHDGSGLLETYIDDISNLWKSTISVGTGNEGSTGGHTSGILRNNEPVEIQFGIVNNELSINLQIWKSYVDEFDISIVHPSGQVIGPLQEVLGPQRYVAGMTQLLIYYGEPSPSSVSQEIYIDFIPRDTYIDSGIWRLIFTPKRIVEGRYDVWLPASAAVGIGTRFYQPTVETTLTIPSTARKVIAVGAYDSRLLTYAPFSGRGYNRDNSQIKPDLSAPGVDITTATPGGGYATVSGTSFATPFVTGAAAMLMQWGMVMGNDPYLYGEKVKAYLIRGARPLNVERVYPNPTLGYGTLCVKDSLPG